MGVASDGDHPLGAGAVADVDLGAALVPDAVYRLPALSAWVNILPKYPYLTQWGGF